MAAPVDFWLNHLTTTNLTVSNINYPTVDGALGSVLSTNGTGSLSLTAPTWTTAPASSTNNAIASYSGISGKILQNTAAFCTTAGVVTTTGLVNGALTYPSVDAASGNVLTTNGSGVLSLTAPIWTTGPASSLNNAIASFLGTSGKILQNTSASCTVAGVVTCTGLVNGSLTFPTTDSTSGAVMTTNGSGSLSLTTPAWVTGPASSTNNAIAAYSGTTGKILQNTSAFCTPAGIVTTTGLVNGSLTYPATDALANAILKTNGAGILTLVNQKFCVGSLTTTQSTNISTGDHVKFNSVLFNSGNISLDTSTTYTNAANVASIGRITLTSGFTYLMIASLDGCTVSNFGNYNAIFQLYNSDTTTAVGTVVNSTGGAGSTGTISSMSSTAIVTPASTTRYEFRITNSLNFTNITSACVKIWSVN
jgi:hypothetical protein